MKYEIEIEIEEIPDGWKPTAFRKALAGECYLNYCGKAVQAKYDTVLRWVILEKIEPRRITFEDTGEIRTASYNEFYEDSDGYINRWQLRDCRSMGEYKIWHKIEE